MKIDKFFWNSLSYVLTWVDSTTSDEKIGSEHDASIADGRLRLPLPRIHCTNESMGRFFLDPFFLRHFGSHVIIPWWVVPNRKIGPSRDSNCWSHAYEVISASTRPSQILFRTLRLPILFSGQSVEGNFTGCRSFKALFHANQVLPDFLPLHVEQSTKASRRVLFDHA